MCAIVVTFVQAVSQVFFPYLSGSSSEMRVWAYQMLRPAIIIFWAGALAMYFPFTAWVEFYLPHYVTSLPLIAILLCMIGFSSQIQIIHLNFFKAYRKQRLYFILSGLSLIFSLALYLLAATLLGSLVSIAVMAVVSSLLWYILNEYSLCRFLSQGNREISKWLLVIGVYIGAFMMVSTSVHYWVYGMIIYLAVFVLVTSTLLKSEVITLLDLTSVMINHNKDMAGVQKEK